MDAIFYDSKNALIAGAWHRASLRLARESIVGKSSDDAGLKKASIGNGLIK
jgi:hypothetical protein